MIIISQDQIVFLALVELILPKEAQYVGDAVMDARGAVAMTTAFFAFKIMDSLDIIPNILIVNFAGADNILQEVHHAFYALLVIAILALSPTMARLVKHVYSSMHSQGEHATNARLALLPLEKPTLRAYTTLLPSIIQDYTLAW